MNNSCNIQFGCGLCAPEGWINFDSSPTLRLQGLPLIGTLFKGGNFPKFPANVKSGDIVKGLPFATGTVDRVYCSHVLEHLALNDFRKAMAETHRLLKPGGTFRLVLPDLEFLARQYLDSTQTDRAARFLDGAVLGTRERDRTLMAFLREWLGGAKHLWMWDYVGIEHELRQAGFQDIRRAEFGDSKDPIFASIEEPVRWTDSLGLECKR